MFGIDSTEFLLIVIVAVIVIGPKDLPRALYKVGQIVGKAQGMARHFRTGIDAMVREVELAELEKKWADQNKRIMEEHPPETTSEDGVVAEALPAPDAGASETDGSGAALADMSGDAGPPPFVAEAPRAAVPDASSSPPYLAPAPQPKGDAAA
ncbi:translocase [Sphingobium aromaticiconvertens]|uniref:translocase n=1 Tax=Sphingobium aromaticiconvertens TaxID=365341 RepID=UPI00301670A5